MKKFIAERDGLLGVTTYIRKGETFYADECPTWAKPAPEGTSEGDNPFDAGETSGDEGDK
jgi:hypothetical protein